MVKPFDAATKHLIEAHPADWLAYAALPAGETVALVDADLSAVTSGADKVLRVQRAADSAVAEYFAHLELQSSHDPLLDPRVMTYNVQLRWRHGRPVYSVVLLLRPAAHGPGATGRVRDEGAGEDHGINFRYKLIRVWEQPVDAVLAGGLGTLPLAPISAGARERLPEVLAEMERRLDREVPPEEADELETAAFILMGLRYSRSTIEQLVKGVRRMKESVTYQMILEEGREAGVARGRLEGRLEAARSLLVRLGGKRFGPPDAAARAAVESITDLARLEAMADRLGDVSGWEQLLATGA